jgi:DNA-binding CsgD family transcriptional regulator
MNPRVARRVLEMFNQFAPREQTSALSQRELEILQLLVAGLINKEIADRLSLSVHSVDAYIRRIYEKLEVDTRTAAAAKALRQGLV